MICLMSIGRDEDPQGVGGRIFRDSPLVEGGRPLQKYLSRIIHAFLQINAALTVDWYPDCPAFSVRGHIGWRDAGYMVHQNRFDWSLRTAAPVRSRRNSVFVG